MEAFVSVDENIDGPSSYFFDLSQASDINNFKQRIKNIITDLGLATCFTAIFHKKNLKKSGETNDQQ